MTAPAVTDPAPTARPDPFAVTSGTTLRFWLLALAMSAAATTVGTAYVGWLITGGDGVDPQAFRECLFGLLADLEADRPTPPSETWSAYCGGPSGLRSALLDLVPLALFWAATLVLYWVRPAIRVKQRGLRPFPADRLPAVAAELSALRVRAGVREDVTYMVDLLDPRVTGLAFGRRGKRYVMLSRGLVHLYDADRTAFRAVVLHELAHLRNRDVDIAFLTDSAWRIYLPMLLGPGIVAVPLTPLVSPSVAGPAVQYFATGLQLILLGTVIPLARKSVLRSRELHADARAALVAEGAAGLTVVLTKAEDARRHAAAEAQEAAKRKALERDARPVRRALARARRWFRTVPGGRRKPKRQAMPEPKSQAQVEAEADAMDVLSTHPSPGARLRALADPRRLFSFSPGSSLALGVAATHSYEPVTGLIRELTGVSRYEPFALLPLGFVLGAGLTLAIWRAELAAHVAGGRWEQADRVGNAFGMGLVLGTVGSPYYAASIGSPAEASPLTMGTASFVLGAGGYLAVRWIAGAARAWAPVVAAGRRPGLVVHGTVLCAAVLLTAWLAFLLQLAPWSVTLASSPYLGGLSDPVRLVVGGVYYLMGVQPFVLTLLLLATALVPLLGAVAARRAGVRAPEPGPGTALRTALWSSGVAAVLWWSVHVFSALFVPGLLPRDPYVYGLVGACLAQVVVALIVERRTRAAARDLSPLHGLLAAVVAGAVLHPTLLLAHDHSRCLRFGFGSANCHILPWAAEWPLLAMPYSWGLIAAGLTVLLRVGLIRRSRRPGQAAPTA